MSPAIRPRSTVPHRSLRIRWGWGCAVAFVMVCSATAFEGAFFPLCLVLLVAWILWRGERDSGCPRSLTPRRKAKK